MKNKKTKVVILCGGQGSRIRDVSDVMPKPMLPIGNRPILWHIMKLYSYYGFKDFVLCLGYKNWVIKEFFLNYYALTSDISIKLTRNGEITYHNSSDESDWTVTLVDTGDETLTGGRVKMVEKYLQDCEEFCLTYGDGVADVDLKALMETHHKSGLKATITGVHPSGRFGEIESQAGKIIEFNEKPNVATGLINGGFMVFKREVLNEYFKGNKFEVLEKDIIPPMVKDRQVALYQHQGFWQCMDTSREYQQLNELWESKSAPWKVWK